MKSASLNFHDSASTALIDDHHKTLLDIINCPKSGYSLRFIIPLQKRYRFASILFGMGVLKKMHHLFFRARANDANSTKSQPKILS